MPRYEVTVKQLVRYDYTTEVEAESQRDAIRKAEQIAFSEDVGEEDWLDQGQEHVESYATLIDERRKA